LVAGVLQQRLQKQYSTPIPTPDFKYPHTHLSEEPTRGTTTFEVRDGIAHTIFEHEATGARLDYVSNSGICETTPGVAQHSGYLNVGGEFLFPTRKKLEIGAEKYRKGEPLLLVLRSTA
jgi:hypothetical protein